MSLRNNYVIKSVRSRPVLFALASLLSAMVTYQVFSGYTRKVIEKQREEISALRLEIKSLQQQSEEYEEIYDPNTGRLIAKRKKTELRREYNRTQEEYSQLKEEYKRLIEATTKNFMFYAQEYNLGLQPKSYIGYTRQIFFLDAGFMVGMGTSLEDTSAALIIGMRF